MDEKGKCVKQGCVNEGKEISITIAVLHTGGSKCPECREPLKITTKSAPSGKGRRSKGRTSSRR